MRRRRVCCLAGLAGLHTLSGCAAIRGAVFGKRPKSFEIRNDRRRAVDVSVVIEGDEDEISSESYRVRANEEQSYSWPDAKAETYTIAASVGDDETAFTFSPSDWNHRQTPVIRVFDGGLGSFVEG